MTTGRVSSVTAEPTNPFAARYNPALLAESPTPLFGLSVAAASSQYQTTGNVLVDSRRFRTQDGQEQHGSPNLAPTSLTLWAVGGTYPFVLPFLRDRAAGLGLTVSGPYGQLHSLAAGTPYDFTTLRYGVGDSQLKGTLSAALELIPGHLALGGGVTFYMTTAGAADAALATSNPSGRMQVDVGLNSAAIAGLYAGLGGSALSFVFHQEIRPTFEQRLDGRVQTRGHDTFSLPFTASTVFFYEPHTFEADIQHDFGPLTASLGAAYALWSRFQPSALVIQTVDADGNPVRTATPTLAMHNTLSPRASIATSFFRKHLLVGAGYEYRPSPLASGAGAANLIDMDTHLVGLSLQHQVAAGELFPQAFRWGVYGQYHWLMARRFDKSSPDFIGAPGYSVSGTAFTYGLSLEADL